MDKCPICNGGIEEEDGVEICETCGTTFKKPNRSRIDELIEKYYAKISKEVWGK